MRHMCFLHERCDCKRTGKTEVHVQHKEMGRYNVSDCEIPKKIHLEVTKMGMKCIDNVEKKCETFRKIMRVNEIDD